MSRKSKNVNLSELNKHLEALVGPALVEKWWDSPNRYWNGFTPRKIYERDAEGKKEVETYILSYCYGK